MSTASPTEPQLNLQAAEEPLTGKVPFECWGRHITQFELVRSDGSRLLCSPTENPAFFAATIGGLGLTGLINWATLRLKPIVSRMIDYEGIQFHGIDEFLDLSNQFNDTEYT